MTELAQRVTVVWNARLQTTAGTANPRTWEVELNPKLRGLVSPQIIQRILRHELAHLVSVWRAGRKKISAHGPEWRQACADLGIPGEQRCHTLPLAGRRQKYKFAYRCLSCGHVLRRVRALPRFSACYDCCRQHTQGRYDERYRYLRIMLPREAMED
jgi:SprT protein